MDVKMLQPFFEAASVAVLCVWNNLFVLHLLGYVSTSLHASALYRSSVSLLSIFMFLAFFLRETFSVLVTGLEHLERKSLSIIYLIIAFSVQLMILREIVIELSKPLKPYILMGTAETLANLFSWLWWSASVALEFCMGLLCHRGSWSYWKAPL